jgi:serine/threonine protein phosphatase PrpC
VGVKRTKTAWAIATPSRPGIFLLADGMGGHPEGEVAAQMALQVISAMYQQEAKPEIEDVEAFFKKAILAAHRQILRYATEKHLMDTPRTTLVAAIVQGGGPLDALRRLASVFRAPG